MEKTKKNGLMIFAVLLISVTAMAASYGGSVVLPQKLTAIDSYDYYSLCAALSSMGMMIGLPLVGVLGSKFGTKVVTLTGMIGMFIFRFILMGVTSLPLFAVLWALQGFTSGLFMSAPYAIMAELVSAEERAKYYGFLTAAAAVGSLAGPYLTGLTIQRISLGAAFLTWAIFAIIPVIVLLVMYPNQKRQSNGTFDFAGLLYFVVFVICLVFWLSLGGKMFPFVSVAGILLPVAAIVSLILLIRRETSVENPAVPVRMFSKGRFRTTFIVQALIVAYSTCVGSYGIPLVLYFMNRDATVSSTVTMPQTIVQLVVSLFIGAYIGKAFKKRFRPFALLAIVAYIVGLVIFIALKPDSSMLLVYLATGIGGIGQAITQATYSAFFQTELKREEIMAAQGMYQFSSTGGSCVFIAICGACVNNLGFSLQQCFVLGTAFLAVALLFGIIGFRFPKEDA